MAEVLLAISALIGIYLAVNVGANTLGATIGIFRGSTNVNYYVAMLFAAAAAMLGVFLLSGRIVSTISHDLIKLDAAGIFAVLLSAAIVGAVVVLRGMPLSTTYIIIGALGGYGLIANGNMNIAIFEKVFTVVFISPFIALALGYLASKAIKAYLKKEFKSIHKIEGYEMRFIASSFLGMLILSFALGANSVGVAMGALGNALDTRMLLLLGSLGLLAGVLFLGRRTAQKTGVELADLSPSRGFIVMLIAGAVMACFAYFGLPISATQILLGAIIGVGLTTRNVNLKQASRVIVGWLVLLPAAIMALSVLLAGGIGLVI